MLRFFARFCSVKELVLSLVAPATVAVSELLQESNEKAAITARETGKCFIVIWFGLKCELNVSNRFRGITKAND
jgi:hypothetical protein